MKNKFVQSYYESDFDCFKRTLFYNMTLIVFLFNLSSVFLLLKQTNLLLESEKAKNEKNLVTVVTHFQNLGVSTLEKGGLRRHDSGLHVF